jgi:RNA polymerase sigma-70 factor (ECF subfamily)
LIRRASLEFRHADQKIVERLLAGDERAFDAIFNGYFPRLYRHALARVGGDRDEARDLVQHTFCKAFERLDSYRGEASLYGWMCQILRNTLIDRVRRRKTENRHIERTGDTDSWESLVESLPAPPDREPEQDFNREHLLQIIQATLDHLPSHYGDVLELKYIDDLSVNEIAGRLSIGPKAAESLLTRARNAFRDAIATISDSADLLPRELTQAVER